MARLRRRTHQREAENMELHVGAPKTEAREAGVYVIPLLRKILAKYKATFPRSVTVGFFAERRCFDH